MASTSTSIPVKSTPLVCHGHTRPVPAISFSPLLPPTSAAPNDPNYLLISACKDGKPMLRDWLGDWLGTFTGEKGHKGAVWSARMSRDGALAVTGSADFSAKVWDTTKGQCLVTLPHAHIVRAVDILSSPSSPSSPTSPSSPSSPSSCSPSILVLTGGHEKRLRLWDLSSAPRDGSDWTPSESEGSGSVVEFVREGGGTAHEGTVKKVLFDEERGQVISMGEDRVIRWWDLSTRQLAHELSFDNQPITSMEKSHDGEVLAITAGKEVIFLALSSREPLLRHSLPYSPSSTSLSPSRTRFVTGSLGDEWVRVHDAITGAELEVGKGHHGPVHAVEYSPDGELYASGSEDGTIRLWQTQPKDYGLWRFNPETGASEGAQGGADGA
ncbi:hypothetical protein JCM8097_005893 [Rhodosporidiobolus ruineniae]